MALVMVPADEVHRVAEVVPVGAAVTGFTPVPVPGAVQGLGVAVGAGRTLPGNKAQQLGARRAGVGLEAGFLVDGGHQNRHRHAELFFAALGGLVPVVEPAAFLVEHRANVVDVGGRGGAAPQCQNQSQNCGTHGRPRGLGLSHGSGLRERCKQWLTGPGLVGPGLVGAGPARERQARPLASCRELCSLSRARPAPTRAPFQGLGPFPALFSLRA